LKLKRRIIKNLIILTRIDLNSVDSNEASKGEKRKIYRKYLEKSNILFEISQVFREINFHNLDSFLLVIKNVFYIFELNKLVEFDVFFVYLKFFDDHMNQSSSHFEVNYSI
jgi:hypothetical protein